MTSHVPGHLNIKGSLVSFSAKLVYQNVPSFTWVLFKSLSPSSTVCVIVIHSFLWLNRPEYVQYGFYRWKQHSVLGDFVKVCASPSQSLGTNLAFPYNRLLPILLFHLTTCPSSCIFHDMTSSWFVFPPWSISTGRCSYGDSREQLPTRTPAELFLRDAGHFNSDDFRHNKSSMQWVLWSYMYVHGDCIIFLCNIFAKCPELMRLAIYGKFVGLSVTFSLIHTLKNSC